MIPVSLIVPIKNEALVLESFVSEILSLNCLPSEIIFIDTGSNDGSFEIINKFHYNFSNLGVNFKILFLKDAFPGKARNFGILNSKNSWVCFLDAGIFPDKNWLCNLWNDVHQHNTNIVYGSCNFYSEHDICKIVCALSYGVNKTAHVLPASIFHKNIFENYGFFDENLRSSEDILLRNNLYKNNIYFFESKTATVKYFLFPDSIIKIIKKWFVYSQYEAIASVTPLVKILAFSFLFIIIVTSLFSFQFSLYLFLFYYIFRGLIDPLRRSNYKKWWSNSKQFFYAPVIALIIDLSSMMGYLNGKFFNIRRYLMSF